jgi:hypothetical protein
MALNGLGRSWPKADTGLVIRITERTPVLLLTEDEHEMWMTAPVAAEGLPQRLFAGSLKVGAMDTNRTKCRDSDMFCPT